MKQKIIPEKNLGMIKCKIKKKKYNGLDPKKYDGSGVNIK